MPPKIFQSFFACFWSFFPYFTWIFFNCAKISQSPISGTPQILIGLVNNTKKWCQKSCNFLWHLNFLLRRCALFQLLACIFVPDIIILPEVHLVWIILLWNNTLTWYCEAQGKGRAKGRPRKVTQKSFIDGRWWMVDILSLMLYIKFGCHLPSTGSLLISRIQPSMDQVR